RIRTRAFLLGIQKWNHQDSIPRPGTLTPGGLFEVAVLLLLLTGVFLSTPLKFTAAIVCCVTDRLLDRALHLVRRALEFVLHAVLHWGPPFTNAFCRASRSPKRLRADRDVRSRGGPVSLLGAGRGLRSKSHPHPQPLRTKARQLLRLLRAFPLHRLSVDFDPCDV